MLAHFAGNLNRDRDSPCSIKTSINDLLELAAWIYAIQWLCLDLQIQQPISVRPSNLHFAYPQQEDNFQSGLKLLTGMKKGRFSPAQIHLFYNLKNNSRG